MNPVSRPTLSPPFSLDLRLKSITPKDALIKELEWIGNNTTQYLWLLPNSTHVFRQLHLAHFPDLGREAPSRITESPDVVIKKEEEEDDDAMDDIVEVKVERADDTMDGVEDASMGEEGIVPKVEEANRSYDVKEEDEASCLMAVVRATWPDVYRPDLYYRKREWKRLFHASEADAAGEWLHGVMRGEFWPLAKKGMLVHSTIYDVKFRWLSR